MQTGVPLDEVKAPTHEFFERARTRLNLEVPPELTDLEATVRIRGDLDLDPVMWEKAGVKATKPAAVLYVLRSGSPVWREMCPPAMKSRPSSRNAWPEQ